MRVYVYVFLSFFILGGGIESYIQNRSKQATFIWWPEALSHIETIQWYQYLKNKFKQYGYHLETQDIHPPKDSDIVIWAYPKGDLSDVSDNQYVVGWLMESPISLKQPLSKEDDQKFDLILTYRTDLVDNKKSFFVRIFTRISEIKPEYWQTPKKVLVSQIASNNLGQGYEERRVAAKWFLENVPHDFNLYGSGWTRIKADLSASGQIVFDEQYKGYVEDKSKAVSESKFVLAYENATQSDYITEKIYDVLKAGAVPVYLGAPNILRHIPKNCFVDKRDFKSYDDLYAFLKNMDDKTYEGYRHCAYRFVQSDYLKQTYIIDRVVQCVFHNKKNDFYDWWNKIRTDVSTFFTHIWERKYI